VLNKHTNSVISLAFAAGAGGRLLLASGAKDWTARIWDVATGECRRVLRGHADDVTAVAFASDGSRLATASGAKDSTARIWSVADGQVIQTFRGHAEGIKCVAWSPDGALLATGGKDRSIRIWSPDGAIARTVESPDEWVTSIIFTADSRELLYACGGRRPDWPGAAVLRVPSGEERVRFTKHDNNVTKVASLPTAGWRPRRGGMPTRSTSGG
jgi:WD40 repeat protein